VKTAPTLTVATALSVLALLPGCGSPNRPATWAYISPVIFQPNCATGSCHSPAAAAGGLDFSTPDRGYSSLTRLWVWIVDPSKQGQPGCGHAANTIVCERMFRPLLTPYDPSQSRLISVLRGRDAPRMPPDRPLDEADIRLVEDWILNGAKKSDSEPRDADGAVADVPSEAGDATDANLLEAPEVDGPQAGSDGADGGAVSSDARGSDAG
jgi:hypothetical protein